MADFVKVTKQGIVAYQWNHIKRDYELMTVRETALPHLRCRVDLEDGLTLGDVFSAVNADPLLMEVISAYSWCGPIHEFHEQAQQPRPTPEDTEEPLVAVVVSPFADFHGNTFDGVYMHFSGLGANGTHFGISCTAMNELAHLPVCIEKTIHFNKDYEKMLDAEYTPSLLEFLDAIYWDISFHGGPKENAEFIADLKQTMKEIETGTAKLTPFTDLRKELELGDLAVVETSED
jgi:hypothetical protein